MSIGGLHVAILCAIIFVAIRASHEQGAKQALLVLAAVFGTLTLILRALFATSGC